MSAPSMTFQEAKEAFRRYREEPQGNKSFESVSEMNRAQVAFRIEYVDNACDTCGRGECPLAYEGRDGIVVASCSFYEYDHDLDDGREAI